MAKYIADLVDYFKDSLLHSHFLNNHRISSCRCLGAVSVPFFSNTIYIGTVSQLPQEPPAAENINFLLIGDVEMPAAYHSHTEINWLICDAQKLNVTQLINKTGDFFQDDLKLANYTEEILSALSSRHSLQQLLEITYHYIGNPLRIIDSAHNMVAAYWGDVVLDEPQWVECQINKEISQAYNDTCNADFAFRHHMLSSTEPYIMNYPNIFKHRQRTIPVRQKEMNIAFISELEYNRPFNNSTTQILKTFSKFTSVKLANEAHFFCSYDSIASELLLHIFNSERPNPAKIQHLMKTAGLHLRKYLYLIYITDGDLFDSREKMVYVRNILDKFFMSALTQIIDGKVIILLDSDSCVKSPISENRLQDFANTLRENDIFAGISRPFRNITEASQALKQAKKAYNYAQQTQCGGYLFYYEDFLLDDIIEVFLSQEPIDQIIEPALYELTDYDQKHNSSLMQTLTCYLNNQMNPQATSLELHVHFNTLKYRLQKIQDITLMDMNNLDNVLRLKLSLAALREQTSI